ncbi:unnamed protein product [Closterium sp. Naga37s-1]|nr:unnamed protein product [Closterium sp. Naga37s-1]
MPPPAVALPPDARRTPSRNSRTARRRRVPSSDGVSPAVLGSHGGAGRKGVAPVNGGVGRLDAVGGEAERAHDGGRTARVGEAAEAEGGSVRKRLRGAGHAAGEGRARNEGGAEGSGAGRSDVSQFLRSWVWKREGKPDVDRFDRPYQHTIARPFCALHPARCDALPSAQTSAQPQRAQPHAAPQAASPDAAASRPCVCEQARVVTIAQQRFGPLGFASTVWDSSIVAGKFLERHAHLVHGKTCIELGAGCGLLGITLAVLGARAVVVTDMPGNLPLLHRNVHANALHHTVHVHTLRWGNTLDAFALSVPAAVASSSSPSPCSTSHDAAISSTPPNPSSHPPTFDLIVATDVVYDHGAVAPLVATLAMLCAPHSSVLLAHGRNRQALPEFLRLAGERFQVKAVAWEDLDETYRCEDVQALLEFLLKEMTERVWALAEFLLKVLQERVWVRAVAWDSLHETYRCEDTQTMLSPPLNAPLHAARMLLSQPTPQKYPPANQP